MVMIARIVVIMMLMMMMLANGKRDGIWMIVIKGGYDDNHLMFKMILLNKRACGMEIVTIHKLYIHQTECIIQLIDLASFGDLPGDYHRGEGSPVNWFCLMYTYIILCFRGLLQLAIEHNHTYRD